MVKGMFGLTTLVGGGGVHPLFMIFHNTAMWAVAYLGGGDGTGIPLGVPPPLGQAARMYMHPVVFLTIKS